jgi:hypothetical protein
VLTPRLKRPPVSKPQKIVDLALSPATILCRERIDASIDADVANKLLRALDEVRYLINGSSAETTCGSCHRSAPALPSHRIWRSKTQSASCVFESGPTSLGGLTIRPAH